jgi:hypothetical protein
MSKYQVGDVVFAPVSYFDDKNGYYRSQYRRFVIVKIQEDIENDIENITVSCTGQLHQSKRHKGVTVLANSPEGLEMALDRDTFIYCDSTATYLDGDILRRIGKCPIIEDIKKLLGI